MAILDYNIQQILTTSIELIFHYTLQSETVISVIGVGKLKRKKSVINIKRVQEVCLRTNMLAFAN